MVRLTSIIWFAAFMRRESERGAYVTAIKKGAEQAGAIFVVHNHLDGLVSLYGPAPQMPTYDEMPDRLYEKVLDKKPQSEASDYLARQQAFDPDIWIIETESGKGLPSLEVSPKTYQHQR